MSSNIRELLEHMVQLDASDLYITVDCPPMYRVEGITSPWGERKYTPEETETMSMSLMNQSQKTYFARRWEMNLALSYPNLGRFRVNIFRQRGYFGMVMRQIKLRIQTIDDLGLPQIFKNLSMTKRGLVLVAGRTGSGKSTTLAALIDYRNSNGTGHIVSVEDPIEFVHNDDLAIVSQREVGIDTESFYDAMKYVVRESPDVILIGEMRDAETMRVALTASETGHLVFSTVHTTSAADTIERIVSIFPPHEKNQICLRLSTSLLGVVSQKLVPRADGTGRVAAVEVMINTPTVAKLIEEGRSGQLYSAITDGGYWGMQTMNQSLIRYWRAGVISEEDALAYAGNLTELKQMLRRGAAV